MKTMRPFCISIVAIAASTGTGCGQPGPAQIRVGDPGKTYRLYQIELRVHPDGSSTWYAAGDNRSDVQGLMPRYNGPGQVWYASLTMSREIPATGKFFFIIQRPESENGHAVFMQYTIESPILKMTQEGIITGSGTAKGQEFILDKGSQRLVPRDLSLPETPLSFTLGPVEGFLPICPHSAVLEMISYKHMEFPNN